MTNDPDRRAVYAAEERLAAWLDSTTPEQPTVTVDGQTYEPGPDLRFTDPESAAAYVETVLGRLRSHEKDYDGREQEHVSVRPRAGRRMAVYERETRTIALPPFAVGGRWALRATVVLHELTHHLSGEGEHTPAFRATFLRLLEDAGLPVTAQLLQLAYAAEGLEQVAHSVDDGTLAKLAKLLRQAERASNEHERAAFLSKAQALATRHSVALAVARAHTAKEEGREQPVAENYRIGDRGKKGLARYVRLLLNIAHANDLRCTISHDSTALTLHGFPSDIAVTKAIYESLLVQMVADCERHLRSGSRDEQEVWDASRRRWVVRPVATITARLAFYEAYAWRIGERLDEARQAALAAAGAVADPATPERSNETALAVRQKEVDVHDFFAEALRRNNIRGTWTADRRTKVNEAPRAAAEGLRAADRARLSDEKALGEAG
ncbi:TIGR04338 family metallohydrolase [Nocardioides humilatus]|uniref:TIGR04338 family metallohydrolase n=1 Tax=Nocardioides humilatus TaxID=2607660 RepID=A0A5B1LGU4_9ACTN|nr:TIGR04338 family metallohydrolase [Nocardioides humilatus]KAA1418847.1 TIGR04338 family metallohydrolase [Nocardioides humilatus]